MPEVNDKVFIAISTLIATIAIYTSLSLATVLRDTKAPTNRWIAILSGSITFGLGVWSVHYIGLLTFAKPGIIVGYDTNLMITSVAVAILGAGISIYLTSSKHHSDRTIVLGNIFFALAATAMHYTGFLAMGATTEIQWDTGLVILSVFVMLLASLISTILTRKSTKDKNYKRYLVGASIAMMLGMGIMHEIGLCSAHLTQKEFNPASSKIILLANTHLHYTVIILGIFIFTISILSTQLSKMLQIRDDQLNKMNSLYRDANASNLAKTRFVANMSHEIRTPLNAITGFAQLLGSNSISQDDREKFVGIILKSSQALTYLIDDIIDLSTIELQKIKINKEVFDLHQLLQETYEIYQRLHSRPEIDFKILISTSAPRFINSDKARIRQILTNLLNNAYKFTPQGKISITCEMNINQDIEISVIDTGIGIPADKHNEIFQPFVQADNSMTRKFSGVGLGLDISRKIASALGGQVNLINSEPSFGSTFRLTLDKSCSINNCESTGYVGDLTGNNDINQSLDITSFEGKKVLIVEDVEDNQTLFKHLLEKLNMEVYLASSGTEAINKIKTETFDVILMDIQMPEMDGITATEKIRHLGVKTPIIVITAHSETDESLVSAVNLFDAYIAKPLSVNKLVVVLTSLLKKEFRS